MAKAKAKAWTNLKGNYPDQDPVAKGSDEQGGEAWIDKVRNEMRELAGKTPGELVERLQKLEAGKAKLEARIKDGNALIRAAEVCLLKELDKQGLESIRAADGTIYGKSTEPSFKVTDEKALDEWIEQQGYEGLKTINGNRLKSLFKDHLKKGLDLPRGIDITVAEFIK